MYQSIYGCRYHCINRNLTNPVHQGRLTTCNGVRLDLQIGEHFIWPVVGEEGSIPSSSPLGKGPARSKTVGSPECCAVTARLRSKAHPRHVGILISLQCSIHGASFGNLRIKRVIFLPWCRDHPVSNAGEEI